MNNKDLFNAIHNVDENYIACAWDNTEADRPIVIRPEQRSGKRTARNIILGVGGAAAAAALGFAVIANSNGLALKQNTTSDYVANSANDSTEFDPNSPIPVEVYAPDGARFTYNDLVGASISRKYLFWKTGETAEEIAQMDDLFENFFEIINPDVEGEGGFWTTGYVYLPEPGSDKLKRYNEGDEYCGRIISGCTSSFDKNCQYKYGDVRFESDKLDLIEVTLGKIATEDNFRVIAAGNYLCTTSDPSMTVLTGELNSEEIHGAVVLYTDIPQNTPVKVGIDLKDLFYGANETPAVTFFGYVHEFEPFNDELKQWLEKDLILPNASLSDDFNFLNFGNIFKEMGDEIRAVDDGEVIETTERSILIKHGENLYTSYYLLDVLVSKGDKVKAGDVIGVANFDGEMDYKFTQERPDIKWFNSFGMDLDSNSDS